MRRQVGKRKEVKVDFASYSYLINGIAGIGKTTLSYEVGKKLYGEDGVMILTIGQEPEPDHLGGVLNDRANDWADLELMVDDLVEFRDTDYKSIRILAIDTVDELFRLAEDEVITTYNASVDAAKRVTSIKSAYGGYQAGENKVVDLVVSTIFKLRDAGFCLFFIGHTKVKNKKDPMTDIEAELLTSNLEAKYYNAIKDKVNIVGCAYIEREFNDIETIKDAFSKKNKQVGKIASEKRVIVFRDEEYAIDVKSHFIDIAPKIDFDCDIFIETILSAIKSQHERYHGETSNEILEKLKEQQAEELTTKKLEIKSTTTEDTTEETKNKTLVKEITEKYKTATADQKANVKAILAKNGTTKFELTLPTSVFESILKVLK